MLSPTFGANPTTEETLPSLTYQIDFETGEIKNAYIDEETALRQAVFKIITTPRFRHSIYSDDYGSELESLITENLPFSFLQYEIPRLIEEALLIDDRIDSVSDFVVSQKGDSMYVEFAIQTVNGQLFLQGVTI